MNSRDLPPAEEVAEWLRQRCKIAAKLAIVLGSGFAPVVTQLRDFIVIPYADIPGFTIPSVAGHAGQLVAGNLGSTPVLMLNGRSHYYEGHSLDRVTFPVRVLAALGIKDLLLTNAAGGINPRFRSGDFMVVVDHINFMGANPLRGTQDVLKRFVDLTEVYSPRLIRLLARAGREANTRLHKGVYLAVSGPTYETPAEIRAFARWGADAVGMSSVPEAILARQCGMSVSGLSCITNLAAGRSRKPLSHNEVLATGVSKAQTATELLRTFASLYAANQ